MEEENEAFHGFSEQDLRKDEKEWDKIQKEIMEQESKDQEMKDTE